MTYYWFMDLSMPAADVLGANQARILRCLSQVSDGLTGRRISELAGVPVSTTQRILASLQVVGLVRSRPAGRASLYEVNRIHLLWGPIAELFATPSRVEQLLTEVAGTFAPAGTSLALYGSTARGEAGPSSDIDLLVVWGANASTSAREHFLERLSSTAEEATGNHVEVVDLTHEELRKLVKAGDPLVESWRRDTLGLAGPSLQELTIKSAA